MEKEFITTDIGLVSTENANWLYKNNIIDESGGIRSILVDGVSGSKVHLYSHFRIIVGDVRSRIPTPPRQVGFGIDDIVEIMRTGEVKIKYKVSDGEEYTYIAKYPMVEKIYNDGRKVFLNRLPKKKGEIDLTGWD